MSRGGFSSSVFLFPCFPHKFADFCSSIGEALDGELQEAAERQNLEVVIKIADVLRRVMYIFCFLTLAPN